MHLGEKRSSGGLRRNVGIHVSWLLKKLTESFRIFLGETCFADVGLLRTGELPVERERGFQMTEIG